MSRKNIDGKNRERKDGGEFLRKSKKKTHKKAEWTPALETLKETVV